MKHQAKIANNIYCPHCKTVVLSKIDGGRTEIQECLTCERKFKIPTVEIEEIVEELTNGQKIRNRMIEILKGLSEGSKGDFERGMLADEFISLMSIKP